MCVDEEGVLRLCTEIGFFLLVFEKVFFAVKIETDNMLIHLIVSYRCLEWNKASSTI